jgi:hypothetical protein
MLEKITVPQKKKKKNRERSVWLLKKEMKNGWEYVFGKMVLARIEY